MAPVHEWIQENNSHISGFKALIYSGDDDAICATLGTQYWLDNTFGDKIKNEWNQWTYDSFLEGKQVGGFGIDQHNG